MKEQLEQFIVDLQKQVEAHEELAKNGGLHEAIASGQPFEAIFYHNPFLKQAEVVR